MRFRIGAADEVRNAAGLILRMHCLCGAPFDLEVTPNLAARLDQAGLTWPPTETLRWSLKDW